MKFWTTGAFGNADDFFRYMKDTFDILYEEGSEHPKMMSIGLHLRVTGRPGRAKPWNNSLIIQNIINRYGLPAEWISLGGGLNITHPKTERFNFMNNNKRTLKEKVYLTLKEKILTQKLRAGDSLSEVDLAKELGVSRTPCGRPSCSCKKTCFWKYFRIGGPMSLL